MTQLDILATPNKALRIKANTIGIVNEKVLKLIKNMGQVLKQSKVPGVGLSATQVGIPLKVFIAHLSSNSSKVKATPPPIIEPSVFINPQITWRSKKLNTDVLPREKLFLEGCLSVPKIYALIKRPWAIKVKYQTISNQQSATCLPARQVSNQQSEFEGFNATLIQHEIDHLSGILFTDRAIKQGAQIYEVGKNEELQPIVL